MFSQSTEYYVKSVLCILGGLLVLSAIVSSWEPSEKTMRCVMVATMVEPTPNYLVPCGDACCGKDGQPHPFPVIAVATSVFCAEHDDTLCYKIVQETPACDISELKRTLPDPRDGHFTEPCVYRRVPDTIHRHVPTSTDLGLTPSIGVVIVVVCCCIALRPKKTATRV